jgi:hypothetical protein
MTQPHSLGTFVSVVLATFALTTISHGQNTQAAPKAAPALSKRQAAGPVTMTECEGTNNCATWTFLGEQGNGQWPSGDVANLSVESLDGDNVVIRRADSTGSSAGLTAVYKGVRRDDRIGGEFTSSWPGHWNNKSGNWYATIGKAAHSLPSVMHFCAAHCLTFTWENGQYTNYTNLPGQWGEKRVLVVESFTRESVVLRRTDTGSYPLTAVMTGQISSEGNSIVNGLSNGSSPYKLTWGTALNSIPGDDGPTPPVVARPVVCYPWFFGMVCSR